MSEEIRLSDDQFERLQHTLTAQVSEAHHHLNEKQIAMLSEFSVMLSNGGIDKFRMLLIFSDRCSQIQKAGTVATVTVIIGALLYVIWVGFVAMAGAMKHKVIHGV